MAQDIGGLHGNSQRTRTLGEFVWRFSRRPKAMLSVQPIRLRERDPHSNRVVVVSAIKREKDYRGSYFSAVVLG
jgi:hypothetical protein